MLENQANALVGSNITVPYARAVASKDKLLLIKIVSSKVRFLKWDEILVLVTNQDLRGLAWFPCSFYTSLVSSCILARHCSLLKDIY